MLFFTPPSPTLLTEGFRLPRLKGENWTVVESVLLSHYRPLTLAHYSSHQPPADPSIQLMMQSELRALLANRILNVDQKVLYRTDLKSAEMERKREQFRYLGEILERAGLGNFGSVQECNSTNEELRQIKLVTLRKLADLDLGLEPAKFQTFRETEQAKQRFPYVRALAAQFGGNLTCVCVYGSSVYSDSPSDYDNFVVVKDLELAYRQARGFRLQFNDRPVHINLLPQDLASKVLASAMIPAVRPETMVVAFGELELAHWPAKILLQHNWVRALEMVRRRRASLTDDISEATNRIASELKMIEQKEAKSLYESFCFLPSVLIEWARRFDRNPGAPLSSKRQIIAELQALGLPLIPYLNDEDTIRRGLIGCLDASQRLLHEATFEFSKGRDFEER